METGNRSKKLQKGFSNFLATIISSEQIVFRLQKALEIFFIYLIEALIIEIQMSQNSPKSKAKSKEKFGWQYSEKKTQNFSNKLAIQLFICALQK